MAITPAARLTAALLAVALAVPAAFGLLAWRALDPASRAALAAAAPEQRAAIAFLGLVMLGALGASLYALARGALGFVPRLVHALDVLRGANPRLRVDADARVPAELAAAINALAEHHEAQGRDVERRITETTAALEQERDLLAGLLAEARAALLVCSMDGRILLYNARARSLLRGALPDEAFVGLGRSVFGLFRRSVILHGLERLQAALERGEAAPTATALINTRRGVTLRAQFTPLQGERRRGFFLTLTDVSAGVEGGAEGRRWWRFAETARARLAGARAVLEVLGSVPDLGEEDRARFLRLADAETAALGQALESADRDATAAASEAALLEEIAGETLLELLRRPLQALLPFPVIAEQEDPRLWLRADSYAVAAALRFIVTQLSQAYPLSDLRLRLAAAGSHAAIDLAWSGTGLLPAPLWQLCTESPITLGDDALPYSVQDVARRHGGEIWQQAESTGAARLRLLLPLAEAAAAAAPAPPVAPSRPEFYAFDLFESAPDEPARQARLRDLICTAFDTETTGLDPEADAIIAIGAIRIVKGRILSQEAFETLVATDRPIAAEALRIHGIHRSALRGQPGIAEVLPRFHRFCEDTVLVGHNLAFDLRFLQGLEATTGVRFRNLVLDTLLLSAVLLPERDAHALEAVAGRLGVPVLGRHTALGDAILAAEVFVRLVPMLEARGVVTVADALEASERTYHARLRY